MSHEDQMHLMHAEEQMGALLQHMWPGGHFCVYLSASPMGNVQSVPHCLFCAGKLLVMVKDTQNE